LFFNKSKNLTSFLKACWALEACYKHILRVSYAVLRLVCLDWYGQTP